MKTKILSFINVLDWHQTSKQQRDFFSVSKAIFFALMFSINAFSQQSLIVNPDFEASTCAGICSDCVAPGWTDCALTPDVLNGNNSIWCVKTLPQSGCTYAGLASGEYIGQQLSCPFVAGRTYNMTVWLAYDRDHSATVAAGTCSRDRNLPGNLQIYGGATSCASTTLLWSSGVLTGAANTWKQYNITFTAPVTCSYIMFRNDVSASNVLLDKFELIGSQTNLVVSDATCSGPGNDGSATVTPPANGTNWNILWSTGATTATITGLAAGTYTVTLTDADGYCTAPVTLTVVIKGPPQVTVSATPATICSGQTSQLNATVSAPPPAPCTYTLNMFDSFGDGWGTPSGVVIRVNGATVGTYTVPTGSSVSSATFNVFTGDAIQISYTRPSSFSNEVTFEIRNASNAIVYTSGANPTTGIKWNGTASCGGTTPTYTYSWSPTTGLSNPNIANPVASPTSTTTYTVTVTPSDNPSCKGIASTTVTINTTVLTFSNVTICSNDPAPAFPSTSGITGSWSPSTVSNTVPNTYTFTPNPGQCATGNTWNVMITPKATPTFTPLAPICSGGTAPTLPTTSNNGIPGTWATLPVSNTTTQTYTFTPSAGQCASTTTLTQTVNTGATSIVKNITNASCGASNGAVTLGAVTGGTPGYTISFNGGGFGSTLTYTGLAPGTYPVVVQDSNGCLYNTTVVIIDQPGPTNIAHVEINSACGNANGSTTLGTVTGGLSPYQYDFDGLGYSTTTNYTGLAAGTYVLNVKDANGCIHNTTVTISDTPGPTNIAWVPVDAVCGTPNGSVTLGSVTGGVGPYQYNFDGLGFSTTTNYGGLAAGGYTLLVRDANGCLYTTTVPISNSGGPTNVAHVEVQSTCGFANGSTTLGSVTGGVPPYEFSFDGSAFSTTINYTGLTAGSYPLEVRDANGCVYTTAVTISDAPGVTDIDVAVIDATCGLANGTATLGTVTGGTPPYEYDFDGSGYSTTTFYGGLAAGSYLLNVRDANGCIYPETVTIIDIPGPTGIASVIVNENCGQADGSVTFGAVTGGTGPYTHNFDNLGYPGVATYTGLAAGTYTIQVTDANGCIYNGSIIITNSAAIIDIVTTPLDASCGNANGSVTLGAVTGGTPGYEYDFNNMGYPGSTSYTGLAAGTYVLNVKDANGCIYTENVVIADLPGPTGIVTSIVDENCGAADGSVTIVSVTGGTAPYEYNFDGMGYPGSTNYTGLSAGSYQLLVKDANGCIHTETIVINNSGGPTNIDHTEVNSTCGAANGSVTLGAVTGGTTPYQYDFNNMGYPGSTTYTGLAAGVYSLDVKDANGCVYPTTITINDSPGITDIANTPLSSTCGLANGSVTLGTVTGGTPPYEYNFNNTGYPGSTSYNGLVAGSYPLIVKDVNGCTYSITIDITDVPGPTAIVSTPTNAACGASDGEVSLGAVTGGTPPYEYDFNSIGYPGSTTYTGLAAGSYGLNVKDANGCIYTTVISISNAGGPTDIVMTPTGSTCGVSNGSVTLGAVTGGTIPYEYNFNNTGYPGSTSYTGLAAGTYAVLVKDASGCIYSQSVVITDTPGPTDIAHTQVDSTCGAANGSVALGAVTGGTGPYTYQFNGSGGYTSATNYSGLSAGTYTIDVQDANGCIYSTGIVITTTAAPTVTIDYPNSPFCVSTVVGQSVTITGSGTYTGGTYSATPAGLSINASTGDITPNTSTPGTYTVTYTIPASGGCPAITDTTSVTINPEVAPTITCGPPTTTSVQFNWTAVVGATAYDVSYVVTGQSPVTVGSITATTYDVTGLTPGSVVTITVTPTNPSGGCFKAASLACTASACTPASADISYGTPFCDNDTAPKPVTITGSGTYTGGTYSAAPAGLIINAATGAITPSGSTPANYTITYLLTGTAGCPDVSDTTTITITPMPTANILYASSSYCTSNTFPQGVSLTGTGAYTGGTYSAAPAGLSINASTGAITPSTSTAGNYTISYSPPPAGGCTPAAVTTTVTITAMPTANISYATPFCISTATPQSVTITGTGAYTGGTYSAPGGLTINSNTGAITPNTSIAGNYLVTYTIPASAGCLASTTTTNVTINGLPVAVATPSTQAICSGSTTSIAISSPTPGTTFAWTVVQSGGAAGASNGTGSNIAQTLTTGTTAGTVVYTITPTANGCSGAPIDVTITVNASPTATATPAVSAICSGQSTGITLTSTLAGTTYSWIANQSGGASGASNGTGNVISQVLTTGTAIGTVIYTITPTANGCVGMPITATVTVTPPPTAIATPDTDTICANQTTNIALSSSVPGTTFSWNVVQTNVSGAGSGTGNVIAQTLQTVIPSSAGEAVYVITPSTNGCPGIPITVRVTVNPNPVLTANPTQDVICSGETTAISLSSNVPGTIFNWTVNQTNLTGTSAGTGNLIAQTLNTVTSADGTAVYTITPVANGCPGNSFDVTVTVRPRPEVFGAPNTTICSGESSNITLAPSPGATTTTFAWTVSQTGVTGATAGSGSFIDQILETTGTTTGTVTYTVTPTANGCEGTPIDLTITVNPLPIPVLEDGIICVDAAGNSFLNYTLDTGLSNAGYDFVWYFNNSTTPISGASNATYSASEEGVYTVVVTNTATSCVSDATLATASATVTPSYPGAIASLSASPAFTNNATITVTMNPPANPNYLYSLDDGPLQESNIFSGVSPGDHTVHVTDINGCTNSTQTVSIIGYPHYFTPNGDNVNDNWNIIGLTDAKIYIFDRYGKLIKQISPNGEGWDGTYNGELLPSTDYWFNVEYIELGQGKIFNSHFSLKR